MPNLTADDFSVYVFDRLETPSVPMRPSKAAPPLDFQEATEPSGVYGMVTAEPPHGGWGNEELVIVVDVKSNNETGRGLINPIIAKP